MPRVFAIASLAVAAAIAVAACSEPQPPTPPPERVTAPVVVSVPADLTRARALLAAEYSEPVWSIQVDLTDPASGQATIVMALPAVPDDVLVFRTHNRGPGFEFSDFAAWDATGAPVPFDLADDSMVFRDPISAPLFLRYRVRPGGFGRHGHQGNLSDRFGVFDGRVFYLPDRAEQLHRVRLRFQVPEGWRVITPHARQGDWYVIDETSRPWLEDLRESCMAFGEFDQRVERIGGTEVSVHTYADWDDAHQQGLSEKTFRLYRHFADRYGFEPGPRYTVVWTPAAADHQKVIGGVASSGMCYEMPEDRPRQWQLFAHRIAHALNRYPPSGMFMRGEEDDWFAEGWASYVEIEATAATGLAPEQGGWNGLYVKYLNTIRFHPSTSAPLAADRHAASHATEFLHYVKAPLVMKMLAYHIEQSSGRNFDEFVRRAYLDYGGLRAPFPFRAELERFSGQSLRTWWEHMVFGPGAVVPVWPEFPVAQEPRTPAEAVGTVDGAPVYADYLHRLGRSGEYATWREVAAQVVAEAARRAALAPTRRQLYPDAVAARLRALPVTVRQEIARYESYFVPEVDTSGLQFAPDTSTGSGRLIARLLDAEQPAGRTDDAVQLDLAIARRYGVVRPRIVLAFDQQDVLEVYARWPTGTDEGVLELIAPDGAMIQSATVSPGQGGARTRTAFTAARPEPGLYRVRARRGETGLAERVYWQR